MNDGQAATDAIMGAGMAPVTRPPCAHCGGGEVDVIYAAVERIDSPGSRVVACRGCGLVFLSPRLASIEGSFLENADYARLFHIPLAQQLGLLDASGDPIDAAIDRYFDGMLQQLEEDPGARRVLDIGCGLGLFVYAAVRRGWDARGVDPSEPLVHFGAGRLGLPILLGDVHSADIPAQSMDAVRLWDVIEHLLDPVAVLREIHRILRPGGRLVVSTPNWNSMARIALRERWEMLVTDHFTYFTKDSLEAMLASSGFRGVQSAVGALCDSELVAIEEQWGAECGRIAREAAATGALGSTLYTTAFTPARTRFRDALRFLRFPQ